MTHVENPKGFFAIFFSFYKHASATQTTSNKAPRDSLDAVSIQGKPDPVHDGGEFGLGLFSKDFAVEGDAASYHTVRVLPPSTIRVVPVMYRAAAESRKAAAEPNSWIVP